MRKIITISLLIIVMVTGMIYLGDIRQKEIEAQEMAMRDTNFYYGKLYINGRETVLKNAVAIYTDYTSCYVPLKTTLEGIGLKTTDRDDGTILVEDPNENMAYVCSFYDTFNQENKYLSTAMYVQEFEQFERENNANPKESTTRGCITLWEWGAMGTSRTINDEIYILDRTATYLMHYFGYEFIKDDENKSAYSVYIIRSENPHEKGPVPYEFIGSSKYYKDRSVRYLQKTEKGEAVTWAEMINTESKYLRIKNRDEFEEPKEIDFTDSTLIITYGRELVNLEYEQDYKRTGKSGTALVFTYSNENVGDVAFFYKLKGNVEYVDLTYYSPTYVIDEKGELVFIGESIYKLDG